MHNHYASTDIDPNCNLCVLVTTFAPLVDEPYEIKCDECKVTIGRTNSVGRSAQGGRCEAHRIDR